jgi:hypothetical protein
LRIAKAGLPDILKPKIPIWENFGGSCSERRWNILVQFGLFYGHLIYFMVIWYVLPIAPRKIWQP